jgi:hypothetical protein
MFNKLHQPKELDPVQKKKKPFYKRWWFIVLVFLFVTGLFTPDKDDATENGESVGTDVGYNEPATEVANKIDYEVTGTMKVEFLDNKIVVTIISNVVDGAIFEVLVSDINFNSVSDYITIENGTGTMEFDIPQEWDVGYVSGLATMRFNLTEHPQPNHVKELYGEVGEKLEGEFAVENNLNGKNISLETIAVPYPNEQAVKDKQDEIYNNSMNELIKLSDGIIVEIVIDSGIVDVTVSDSWYYSADYEKERFAEQVSGAIQSILISTEKAKSDEYIPVYFYDTYGKELATPKILGGYKIVR